MSRDEGAYGVTNMIYMEAIYRPAHLVEVLHV